MYGLGGKQVLVGSRKIDEVKQPPVSNGGRSQAEETVGSLVPSPLGEHFILNADLSKDGSARVLIETALSQFDSTCSS